MSVASSLRSTLDVDVASRDCAGPQRIKMTGHLKWYGGPSSKRKPYQGDGGWAGKGEDSRDP